MRIPFLVFVLLCANSAFAEQSLFNVPSSQITAPAHIFFQEQVGFSSGSLQSNSVFCYGLGHDAEVGLNITGLNFGTSKGINYYSNNTKGAHALSPLLVAEFQKRFRITEDLNIAAGVLFGTNAFHRISRWQPASFNFINATYDWEAADIEFYLGTYLGSRQYLGGEGEMNFMAGLEWRLLPENLHIVIDHIHGLHDMGVSVLGLAWFATHRTILSAGLQVPNPGSGNPYGIVFEYTAL